MVWDPRSDSGSDDAMVVSMQEALACVCLASTHDEAMTCRQLLSDYNIPAIIGGPGGLTPADAVPVLVPKALLDEANDVISRFAAAGEPDEWDGEPLDDDDDDDDDDLDDDDDEGDDLDDDFEDELDAD